MWNWESRLPDLLSEEMSQLDLHKSSGKCVTFAPEVAQHQESQPTKSEMVLNTRSNPTIVEWPSACPKRKFVGRGQGVIRDLPKRKKRNRKKESGKIAKLRKKYATRRMMGPRTWDEAKRRFWREWAQRRTQRAQRWTVSRVPPMSSLGLKAWRQKENLEIVELELCIVDHANL